jgi:hypothetical protein
LRTGRDKPASLGKWVQKSPALSSEAASFLTGYLFSEWVSVNTYPLTRADSFAVKVWLKLFLSKPSLYVENLKNAI